MSVWAQGPLQHPTRALDRLERNAPARLDVLRDRLTRGRDVRLRERLNDACVLGHEVSVTFDAPSADDLHQQVHRELSVEAGKQGVSGEVDLILVEGGVRRVPRPRGRLL